MKKILFYYYAFNENYVLWELVIEVRKKNFKGKDEYYGYNRCKGSLVLEAGFYFRRVLCVFGFFCYY